MINQKPISKRWVVFSYLLIAIIAMVGISFFDTHQPVTAASQDSSQHSVNSKLLLTPTLNPLPLAGKKIALLLSKHQIREIATHTGTHDVLYHALRVFLAP